MLKKSLITVGAEYHRNGYQFQKLDTIPRVALVILGTIRDHVDLRNYRTRFL